MVGQSLAGKLASLGHEVTMGARQSGNEKAVAWAAAAGDGAREGTFADAAAFGELVINATGGMVSLEALATAGAENLAGKVLVDVSNPLDFSKGMPPTLCVCNTDSVAEQIQRAHPSAKVVKAFNTVNAGVMVEPGQVPGSHNLFVCGDDADAKLQVKELAVSFGWPAADILDLGDIAGARGLEMYVILWLRLANATGSWQVNIHTVAPPPA